jgi:hypothetical protein
MWVTLSPAFEPNYAVVTQLIKFTPDSRVVDFSSARLATTRNIGNLNFAKMWESVAHQLNEITLTDLCVIEV